MHHGLPTAAFAMCTQWPPRTHLVDVARCYELWDLVHNIDSVPGCVLEVGVWRGGTGAVLARAMLDAGRGDPIYLCDTFTGVVKAGQFDASYRGGEHRDTSLAHVRGVLDLLGISNAVLLQGIFPDETCGAIASERIALCHIDVDVYQSAKDIFAWVVPQHGCGCGSRI